VRRPCSAIAHDRPDAIFIATDNFYTSRGVQFAALTAHNNIPSTYSSRDYVAVGGLMSYGADVADMFHQVGVYTGSILKGAKPADIPVEQPTKIELVVNLKTAKALGLAIPETQLLRADDVIE
jgi:putative ABC transport system substrate-binding protein